MWTRYSRFQGSWLDIEAINSKPNGSLSTTHVQELYANVEHGSYVQ
jgi:hypothetical protein